MNNKLQHSFAWILVACMAISGAMAQSYEFKVLGSKGQNRISGKKALIGSHVQADDVISVVPGGYIGLAHSNGRTWETIKAGNYKAADIAKKLKDAAKNQGNQYVRFVADELTGEEGDRSRFARVKTGSVTRSLKNEILMSLPDQVEVLSGQKVAVSWKLNDDLKKIDMLKPSGKYKIVVTSLYNTELIAEETDKTSIDLDLAKHLEDHGALLLRVYDAKNKAVSSAQFSIIPANEETEALISQFIAENQINELPLSQLTLAQYLEEQGLWLNAAAAYQNAISMLEADQAKKMFNDFLVRTEKAIKRAKEEKEAEMKAQAERY